MQKYVPADYGIVEDGDEAEGQDLHQKQLETEHVLKYVPADYGIVEDGDEAERQDLHQQQLEPDQVQGHVQRVLYTTIQG